MQALQRPAGAGWRWIVEGYATFRRNPGLMIALAAGYWMILFFSGIVPLVGSVVGSVVAPALSVGVMNACRELEAGRRPAFDILFSAFKRNPRTLFALGALYLVTTLSILAIVSLIDGGALFRMMTVGKVNHAELIEAGSDVAAQVGVLLMAPVVMAWWYAPMLASWHGVPAAKALFFSFVACWRNWRAFLVYGIGATVLILPPLFVILLMAPGGPGVAVLLFVPALFFLAPVFFASFYVSYRDVFVGGNSAPPAVDVHA
jgi:hypothetical protein